MPVHATGIAEPVSAVSGALSVTSGAMISIGVVASVRLPSRST
ncbi:MAG: hypothetical protein M5U35_00625 [Roseovarius sp.]|nr:hypothetical protein [Roseovarius sp.]